MWISDGEKYALVGLKVKLEGAPPPEEIAPNLWVLTATTFERPVSVRSRRERGGTRWISVGS